MSRLLNVLASMIVTCAFLFAQSGGAQSIPVPEYFGVYAVVDGHLLKLDGQELHPDMTVNVRLGRRTGVADVVNRQPGTAPPATVQVPELPADLKIVIFGQSSGTQSPLDIAKSLHLESLVYVRNLSVDTGWPSNINRTDPENGWDSGDAVELAVVAGGDRARELEFLVKPMPGHQDMVVAGLSDKLRPGVYRLTMGQRELFTPPGGGMLFGVRDISQGEEAMCVDAVITYAMTMARTKYTPCTASSSSETVGPSTSSIAPGEGTSGVGPSAPPVDCADYGTCFEAGMDALMSSNGTQVIQSWDRALRLGGSLHIPVCRERPLRCEKGTFSLGTKEVSFINDKNENVFSVAPTQVGSPGTGRHDQASGQFTAFFRLRVQAKNYNFDYSPASNGCRTDFFLQCPGPGPDQQQTVAQYVARTIPKLVSGELARSDQVQITSSSTPQPATEQPLLVEPPTSTPGSSTEPPLAEGASPAAACNAIPNPVVPGACLGQFKHGTVVAHNEKGELVVAPSLSVPVLTHAGVDLVADCGTPVSAFASGTVADVINSEGDQHFKFLGYMVLINQSPPSAKGKQTFTLYLHMEHPPEVKRGQVIKRGTELGWVGKTGVAWGCHTHFEIRHFAGRYLQNPAWNFPFNIYGRGDQRDSALFQQSWEDPEKAFVNAESQSRATADTSSVSR